MFQSFEGATANDAWLRILNEAEVPCAPIQTIDQVFHAPQVLHRDMLVEVAHPTAGTVRMAGLPVKLSATPASRIALPVIQPCARFLPSDARLPRACRGGEPGAHGTLDRWFESARKELRLHSEFGATHH